MRNVGKHVAVITELKMIPIFHARAKKLADTPDYNLPQPNTPVVPPIVPDTEMTAITLMDAKNW
jgi:hypothetical protein